MSLVLLAPASAALALSRPLFVDTFPFGFRGVPASVKADKVKVLLFNRPTNAEEHESAFFKLAPENEGATIADAIAAADAAGGSDDDPTFGGFTTGFNGEVAEIGKSRQGHSGSHRARTVCLLLLRQIARQRRSTTLQAPAGHVGLHQSHLTPALLIENRKWMQDWCGNCRVSLSSTSGGKRQMAKAGWGSTCGHRRSRRSKAGSPRGESAG